MHQCRYPIRRLGGDGFLYESFRLAAVNNDVKKMEELALDPAFPPTVDTALDPAIVAAAGQGSLEAVEWLLARGASATVRNSRKESPLDVAPAARAASCTAVIAALLAHGAVINESEEYVMWGVRGEVVATRCKALITAARVGNAVAIRYLLDLGADRTLILHPVSEQPGQLGPPYYRPYSTMVGMNLSYYTPEARWRRDLHPRFVAETKALLTLAAAGHADDALLHALLHTNGAARAGRVTWGTLPSELIEAVVAALHLMHWADVLAASPTERPTEYPIDGDGEPLATALAYANLRAGRPASVEEVDRGAEFERDQMGS